MYATRSFLVDEESVVTGVMPRLADFEAPNRSPTSLFYENPFSFPAVTVPRTSYEALGGFRTDLGFVADWEMWARITDSHGAFVSRSVLAFNRWHPGNATWEYYRTADDGRDILRLSEIFAKRYKGFSLGTARCRRAEAAWRHYNQFKSSGDEFAAKANRQLWVELTPLRQRAARQFKGATIPIIRRLVPVIRRIVLGSCS
jgi:hypothetical protein